MTTAREHKEKEVEEVDAAMTGRGPKQGRPGIPVDFSGASAIDPTANVLIIVEAAVKRIDDLRGAEIRRSDDLRHAEMRRVDEQMNLRTLFEERLSLAEAKRIDAIRAVDVAAVAVASQKAADQAAVLAAQVAQSAEALRALVATTAASGTAQQQQLGTALSSRITALEQAQYEGRGKQAVADPAQAALMDEMRKYMVGAERRTGKESGVNWVGALIVGGVSLIGGLIGIGAVLFALLK